MAGGGRGVGGGVDEVEGPGLLPPTGTTTEQHHPQQISLPFLHLQSTSEELQPFKGDSEESDARQRQSKMESTAHVLINRIHRLQGKQCQRHLHRHLSSFVRQQQGRMGLGCLILKDGVRDRNNATLTSPFGSYPPYTNGMLHSPGVATTRLSPVKSSEPNITTFTDGIMNDESVRISNQDGVKNVSTTALVNLVKRLDSENANDASSHFRFQTTLNSSSLSSSSPGSHPHLPPLHHFNHPHSYKTSEQHRTSDATTKPLSPFNNNNSSNTTLVKLLQRSLSSSHPLVTQPLDNLQVEVIDTNAGQLRTNLEHLEEEYDSDATESSSGGESCDEGHLFWEDALTTLSSSVSTPNTSTPLTTPTFSSSKRFLTLSPKAEESLSWKWAVERGAIASRWMWLIAQVADLEFKIRQQNEMYRSLRLSKGPIVLEARAAPESTSQDLSNILPEPGISSQGVNSPNQSSFGSSSPPHSSQEPSQCVRTMAVRSLRRKLVRSSTALAGVTRKNARFSTVQCSCNCVSSFVSPCVLCNGKYSYVQVIDTDCMPVPERAAILDSSCHPILSLPNQVPLGLHISKFLKKETVHKSGIIKKQLNKKKTSPPSEPSSPNKHSKDHRRNHTNNHNKKSAAVISSNKLKKKYDVNSKRKFPSDHHASGKMSKTHRERHESSSNASADSSRHDSPIPSPLPTSDSTPSYPQRRRRSDLQHAYDINNIVIPYSIASTTRVEKLQYKEILTPKWREIDFYSSKNDEPPATPEEEPIEDLSDSVFLERHLRCEVEERKRFLAFLTPNTSSQGSGPKKARSRTRTESKSDAACLEKHSNTTTNGFADQDGNSQDSFVANNKDHRHLSFAKDSSQQTDPNSTSISASVHGNPARAFERRRTTSSSRTREDSLDEDSTPDVLPFEKRSFPLGQAELEELIVQTRDTEKSLNGHNGSQSDLPSPTKSQIGHNNSHHTDSNLNFPTTPRPKKSLNLDPLSPSSGESIGGDEREDPEWQPEVES